MTNEITKPLVYLDANVFIFFFEGAPTESERIKALLDELRNYPGSGVTSELTLAEVLAGSEHPRSAILKRAYLNLIIWSRFIDLVPVSRDILVASAKMRAAHKLTQGKKLKLADAIHLASARQKNCRYFVSADKGIRPPKGMKIISPVAENLDEVLKAFA